ncbi:hypothetical protein Tco_1011222, partial [Tanacetum coccineum]
MDLVVCPNTRGKLRKGMLSYVQDVNHLNDHPWLYYMSKLHEGLVLSKIDDSVTTQFKSNWERDYAVVTGKSKPLMDETWGILKEIHKNYSANRKSVVELNLLSRKMQNYQSVWLLNHQAHGSDRPSSEDIPLPDEEETDADAGAGAEAGNDADAGAGAQIKG